MVTGVTAIMGQELAVNDGLLLVEESLTAET